MTDNRRPDLVTILFAAAAVAVVVELFMIERHLARVAGNTPVVASGGNDHDHGATSGASGETAVAPRPAETSVAGAATNTGGGAAVAVDAGPPSAVVDVEVGGAGGAFVPSALEVHAGDSVRFTSTKAGHSIVSGDGASDGVFCSPFNFECAKAAPSAKGAIFVRRFDLPGVYKYFCRQHAGAAERGTITVK